MTSLPLAMVLALFIPSMAGQSYVALEDALIASVDESLPFIPAKQNFDTALANQGLMRY